MMFRTCLQAFTLAVLSVLPRWASSADGDLDPTFSGNGIEWYQWSSLNVQVEMHSVLALADGSMVTVGWADAGNDNRSFAFTKFTTLGVLDSSFGDSGKLIVPFDMVPGGDDRGLGVFAATGNKLLALGSVDVGAPAYRLPALLRLNADGTPDVTFGISGKRVVSAQPFGNSASFSYSVAKRAPDGKLLLAGHCQNCGNGGAPDFMVVRFSAEGDVDTSFGNAGWANFGRQSGGSWLNEQVIDVVADTAGRVILAGTTTLDSDPNSIVRPLLVRLSNSGQLDTTFNGTGFFEMNLLGSWGAFALAIDPLTQGPVFAVNTINPGAATPATMMLRLTGTGALNTAFGVDGIVDLTREEGTHIDTLIIRADRRIMAAGWIDPTGTSQRDFFLARVISTGDLDNSFDGNGVMRVAFDIITNSLDDATAMTLSNERVVVTGTIVANTIYSTGVLRLQSQFLFGNGFD